MKKILLGILALVAITLSVNAQVASGTWAAGNTNLVVGQVNLTSLTLVNTNTTVNTVKLFDAPLSLYWTNSAYVTRSESASTVITTNIDYFGLTNKFTNTVLVSTLTTNAAATNLYPIGFSVLLNTNSTYTIEFPVPLRFQNGINMSNTATVSVTATYSQ